MHIVSSLANRIPSIFLVFVVAFIIESFSPIDKVNGRGLRLNCIVGFFFLLVQEFTFLALAFLVAHPRGLVSLLAVPDGGNPIKALGLAFAWLAMRDFFYYWLHRLQHASRWLWAEHMLHHSDENVNATTSIRHHWLENPLTIIFINAPLFYLLRPPLLTVTVAATILGLTEFSNHMNFKFGLGGFSWLISTPQNHRIHHSRLGEHIDKNFAAFFPVWDVLFGTYYAPKKDEYPPVGLAGGERVTTIWQALVLPFLVWRRMLR